MATNVGKSDDFWGIIGAMLLCGMLGVLFARLFVPMLIIFVVYLVYYLSNEVYLFGSKILVALGVATAFSGILFFATLGKSPEAVPVGNTAEVPEEVESSGGEATAGAAVTTGSGVSDGSSASSGVGVGLGSSTGSSSNAGASSDSGSGAGCLHYEAGRCWDDLEEEIYVQGQYDRYYGYYGGGYYEDDDCDEVCRDILEDAYEQGYEGY